MTAKQNRAVTIWLFTVAAMIMFMTVLGGYVRLTRSGLSIVEWNPISGVIPPIGEEAWEEEFAKYQETPEFQYINQAMTLEEYKRIFNIEYVHRLLARMAGLFVAIPLLYFLIKGIIPWRKSGVYVAIALLFAFQGVLGWYMVSSGLNEVPAVSPFRLTIHLMMALFLLALTLWMAFNHLYGFPARVKGGAPLYLSIGVIAILVIQIAYGGLMAGLKAGHVSNTWPLMFGRLIPSGMFASDNAWWVDALSAPVTVHFIHRWLAFGVLLIASWLYLRGRRQAPDSGVTKASRWLVILVGVQIALGVSVVWFNVPLVLALAHQATALVMFVLAFYITFQLSHEAVVEDAVVEEGQAELTAA